MDNKERQKAQHLDLKRWTYPAVVVAARPRRHLLISGYLFFFFLVQPENRVRFGLDAEGTAGRQQKNVDLAEELTSPSSAHRSVTSCR